MSPSEPFEITARLITFFAEDGLGLMIRCHHCNAENRLGFGDWAPRELFAKADAHRCGEVWA